MTNRLEALEVWAAGLLGQLEPTSRKRLIRSLGQTLRRNQQQRIITQRNPEGSKFAPRKQRNLRGKQGRVKRRVLMFQKLRTARFFKVQDGLNSISVGFTGRTAHIARVHQYGMYDRAERNARHVRYKKREMLGFTNSDLDKIRDGLLLHLTQ